MTVMSDFELNRLCLDHKVWEQVGISFVIKNNTLYRW
jgi:hypothetical protein